MEPFLVALSDSAISNPEIKVALTNVLDIVGQWIILMLELTTEHLSFLSHIILEIFLVSS